MQISASAINYLLGSLPARNFPDRTARDGNLVVFRTILLVE